MHLMGGKDFNLNQKRKQKTKKKTTTGITEGGVHTFCPFCLAVRNLWNTLGLSTSFRQPLSTALQLTQMCHVKHDGKCQIFYSKWASFSFASITTLHCSVAQKFTCRPQAGHSVVETEEQIFNPNRPLISMYPTKEPCNYINLCSLSSFRASLSWAFLVRTNGTPC